MNREKSVDSTVQNRSVIEEGINPALAELISDIHRADVPQHMPAYSREFDRIVGHRLSVLVRDVNARAEIERLLRRSWSSRALILSLEQP